MAAALLVLRLFVGFSLAAHGTQKLFGWFGGYGLAGTGGFFEGLGFRPGQFFAAAAGLAETVGGLLTAAGFLNPIGPALILSVVIVATVAVHLPNGFFGTNNGIELTSLYGLTCVLLAATGPGPYSLDDLLGWQVGAQTTWLILALAAVGSVTALVTRRPAHQAVRTAA